MNHTFQSLQDRSPLALRFKTRIKDGFAQTQDCMRVSRFAMTGSAVAPAQLKLQPVGIRPAVR